LTGPIAALAVLLGLLAAPALAQAPAQPARPAAQPAPRPAPAVEMVTEANLSRDGLKAAFDAAKLATSIDAAGNLMVRIGDTSVHVLPSKDVIRLVAHFAFAPRATLMEKLDLANRINDGYIVVRAAVPADRIGDLNLDLYIVLGSGVSRANVVTSTRRFVDIVVEAIAALDSEQLLK
jgi:hypothetical protein